MDMSLFLFFSLRMSACVWWTKHIRFSLKISPIGLFTIQIEAGCVNRRLRLKMDCKNLSSPQPMHTHTPTRSHTFTHSPHCTAAPSQHLPQVPSFLAVSSGFLIKSQELMAVFTPAAACDSCPPSVYLPGLHSALLVWESWPPASAGLSAARAHRLFCRRESPNRWRATFPPVKCKCYKVQHHVGRVLLQIKKDISFILCTHMHTSGFVPSFDYFCQMCH